MAALGMLESVLVIVNSNNLTVLFVLVNLVLYVFTFYFFQGFFMWVIAYLKEHAYLSSVSPPLFICISISIIIHTFLLFLYFFLILFTGDVVLIMPYFYQL